VLVLWADRDPYLGPELATVDARWAPQLELVRLDAGHFVQHERAEQVNQRLIDFLRRERAAAPATV
jgi:pimeloyl-ACP methyl ester carboxylesterase